MKPVDDAHQLSKKFNVHAAEDFQRAVDSFVDKYSADDETARIHYHTIQILIHFFNFSVKIFGNRF